LIAKRPFLKKVTKTGNDSIIKTVALSETGKDDNDHLAAMKIVANAMLNLDEFIMKN
jgi:hypothetical protein